jgi:hypothetical protein
MKHPNGKMLKGKQKNLPSFLKEKILKTKKKNSTKKKKNATIK